MQHPMKQLKEKSTIVKDLKQIAHDVSPWVPYFNFMAKPVPYSIVFKEPFFQWLSQRHKFISGILKMEPYQQYDWHVDTRRGVGINMLIEPADSQLLFTETPTDLVKSIYPQAYLPKTYYLFNTQVPHSVINYGTPRYLFTVEFEEDLNALSFDDLKQEIKDEYRGGPNGEQE